MRKEAIWYLVSAIVFSLIVACANPVGPQNGGMTDDGDDTGNGGTAPLVITGSASLAGEDEETESAVFSFTVPQDGTGTLSSPTTGAVNVTGSVRTDNNNIVLNLTGVYFPATGDFILSTVGTLLNLRIDIAIEGTYVPAATAGGTPSFAGTEVKLAVTNTTTDETTVFRGTEVVPTTDDPAQAAPGAETPPAQGETVATEDRNVWHGIGVWSLTFQEEYKGRTVNVTSTGRANATGVFWDMTESLVSDDSEWNAEFGYVGFRYSATVVEVLEQDKTAGTAVVIVRTIEDGFTYYQQFGFERDWSANTLVAGIYYDVDTLEEVFDSVLELKDANLILDDEARYAFVTVIG